jgi:bacteriocin biosynthesis cyclodehydratase domain-containing protein
VTHANRADGGQVVGLKRHLRAQVVPGDAVYIFSEGETRALHGTHVESVVPLLDGSQDLTGLRRTLPAGVDSTQVVNLLANLAEAELIALRPPRPTGSDPAELAYWDACGIDAEHAVDAVAAARVGLCTVGIEQAPAVAALRSSGLTVTTSADLAATELSVVLCHDYLAEGLAEIDAAHRAAGRPWLLAKPTGTRLWLGPVLTPGDGACWHCLAVRLWEKRPAEAHVRHALALGGALERPAVTTAPLTAFALNLVAMEATKWLAGYRYPGQRGVWTLDSVDLQGRYHEVRARPQCASCGDISLMRKQAQRPVILRSRVKAHASGGGHRARPPEEVLADYRHLISPLTGVIREIRRDDRGPAFLNGFRSGPNLALAGRGARALRTTMRDESAGKGITALHAEVSALCEGLERYSACFRGDEERLRGSLRSLGEMAVHPDACQLFDPRQFADRERWNPRHGDFQFVCDPFDENEKLDWTPVWSLTARRQRLLPTGFLYFGVPVEDGAPLTVLADSNGNAAGSCLEDAVLQGMLEVVERDAVAVWWYNRLRQRAVDLASFGDPWIREMQEVYSGLDRELWVLDLTTDLGVPAMAAVSSKRGPSEDIVFGFGAHLDPQVALRRALTELSQMLPAVLEGGYTGDEPDMAYWWANATVADEPYVVPDPTTRPSTPDDFGYTPAQDLLDDVRTVRRRLEAAGLEVLVLDQTRPDIGLPVVKVIVPGMRSMWSRFAPGRLFDVPVRLGRLAEPTPYDELNPLPMFM